MSSNWIAPPPDLKKIKKKKIGTISGVSSPIDDDLLAHTENKMTA